jgi:type III pantothenate kinase
MNLVLDIGNTSVKAALFEGNDLTTLFSSATEVKNAVVKSRIKKCIISKTGSDHPLEDFLNNQIFKTRYFSSTTKLPFSNSYGTPDTVGTDRLALVAGASALFPSSNLLCIDTGTCITYNFINSKNEFLGGSIAPGIEMRFKALHHFTARLPLVKWKMDEVVAIHNEQHNTIDKKKSIALIGSSTETSILSGVLNGMAAETDGIINQYKKRYKHLTVVITGGSLPFFASALENVIFARPNLVLHGLNTILEYNS